MSMISVVLANNKTPTPLDPTCQTWGTFRYDPDGGDVRLVTADGHVIFEKNMAEAVRINHKVKDVVVEVPKAILVCKNTETAAAVQEALVNAGFSTDRPQFSATVHVWQGDGTI